ncbi:7693_t:CDS:2 [Rhizophagus irregularis]|nr:7693_t:CDS:2 [Rhizophagus irregularis]
MSAPVQTAPRMKGYVPFVKLFEFVVDNISSQKLGFLLRVILVSGMRFNNIKKQKFNGLSLTTLAYNSLIIPAAFNFDVESIDNQLLSLPYVMATVILIFTILYRYFQIKPNLDLYHEERQHQRLSLVTAIGKILRTTGSFRSKKTAIFITMLIALGWQMKLTSRPPI